ncbi:MAG: lactate utilization protein [Bacilli bacterium]
MNINKTIKNLENRGYNVIFIEDKNNALEVIMNHIDQDEVIAFGGSTTLSQLGVVDYILNNDYKVLNRYQKGLSNEEIHEVERRSLLSDIYITGTNAIAETGELVNIDGKNNRVAAQIFGPKRVFLVTGINKICSNLDDAIDRAKNYAAPINAKRFEGKFTTGCMNSGVCNNCIGSTTICKTTVITRRVAEVGRTTIFLINEDLGF